MNAPLAAPATASAAAIARRRVRVRGRVQGVGFRPFVYRLATELALAGSVHNDGEGVAITLQGSEESLRVFLSRLQSEAPRLARIESVESSSEIPLAEAGFRISASDHGAVTTGVTPDAAICPECLAELCDPSDRRHRYAFLNCTHCGPRYTITAHLPYDRPQTSMAVFTQCPACQSEYEDPANRRFHAQPNACPVCGPRLSLWSQAGEPVHCADVIAAAVERIRAGEILAIKGLGGFHLVCDAGNAAAVATLRARKHRDEKPLAVMVAGLASARQLATVSETAARLLESPERPIVLCPKRAGCDESLPGVADGVPELGLMLPYTPVHYLLFHEAAGQPAGTDWLEHPQPWRLVMTSANPGGEPLVTGNTEAVERLGAIADALVVHDREILIRCDDSVVRTELRADSLTPRFVRRARGYTPAPIALARSGPAVLALGAYLKNTACLTRGGQAFLSQHIGDLENAASCVALEAAVDHLQSVLEIRPELVAHDLHPDFYSTRLAARLAQSLGVPAIGVQHHHAHIAAVMAEHRVTEPVLGLALDGVGLGTDGAAWGGELLRVDAQGFARLAHLAELRLPGGDRAAREPWRVAASVLHQLGRGDEIARRFAFPAAATVTTMLDRNLNCPATSSLGRWFDAAAGLLGVRSHQGFEGQAPMLLEALAQRHGAVAPLAGGWVIEAGQLDLLPLMAQLADETDPARGAALFHATLIEALAELTAAAARESGIGLVAFGGGCFMNRILSTGLRDRLTAAGLTLLEAEQAPANDGGIALGQAWAAALAHH
ncbi:MAG: carbamoyltransferase HypF [Burkholderiaceae bacterium]